MAYEELISKIHDLSDLELAALLCLIAQEHCIIDTEPACLDDLVQELELVATKVFGLSYAVVDCSEQTTLDDFAHAILTVENNESRSVSPIRTRGNQDSYFLQTPAFRSSLSPAHTADTTLDNNSIANVIIAKNLDEAPRQVQIQALELLRAKRIYTRTSVHHAPSRFLFIALLAGGEGPRLTKHLNDYIFISHFHDPEDGFPNLDEIYGNDGDSSSSVVKRSPTHNSADWPRITLQDIDDLAHLSNQVTVSVEVKQYQVNIISFLRLHRAVAGGVSAVATQHYDKLVKCLTPLHGLPFATPSLIALAARKIYLHRIQITEPENERSMQWGSEVSAVAALLEGVGPEDVIEDSLGSAGAEAPL